MAKSSDTAAGIRIVVSFKSVAKFEEEEEDAFDVRAERYVSAAFEKTPVIVPINEMIPLFKAVELALAEVELLFPPTLASLPSRVLFDKSARSFTTMLT